MADNLKEIECPACGKKMKKVFINQAGFNLDICLDGCGGIYFDNREIKKFDEKHESIDEILELIKDKKFKPITQEGRRTCPVCGAFMVKNHTSVLKEVLIDECYSCGGKFFDHGELTRMREEYDTESERAEEASKYFIEAINLKIQELKEQGKPIE